MNMVKHSDFSLRPSVAGKLPISILDLLHWAFVRECAQLDFDEMVSSAGGQRVATDVIWHMMQTKNLGCRVDGGGRSEPHPDADIVASAVANLPIGCGGQRMAIQVAELVRSGQTPDWRSGAKPRCRPVEWKTGKHGPHAKTERVGVVRYFYRGLLREAESRCCPVHYQDTASEVAAARRRYIDWWSALLELRTTFQIGNDLSCWSVTDEMPDRSPWQKTS